MNKKKLPYIYVTLILLFLVIINWRQHRELKCEFYKFHRISNVIQSLFRYGPEKTIMFLGNSFVQSVFVPTLLNSNDTFFLNLGIEDKSALRSLNYLKKNGLYPQELFVQLTGREFTASYLPNLDIIKPDSKDSFDIFKASFENEMRLWVYKYAPIFTYSVSLKNSLAQLVKTRDVCSTVKNMFYVDAPKCSQIKFHSDGLVEHLDPFTPEQVKEKTDAHIIFMKNRVQTSSRFLDSTIKEIVSLSRHFLEKGTRISFFRLPQHMDITREEDRLLNTYFESVRTLAIAHPNARYLDFANQSNWEKFKNGIFDGAHWKAAGAKKFTKAAKKTISTWKKTVGEVIL